MSRAALKTPSAAITMTPSGLAGALLAWYDRHGRVLPWRAKPGERADPYAVWLSEIMLQQTTVATVGPYFQAFLERWPTVETLAAASLDEVLHAWAGLGYYSRARNLHACAQLVAGEFGGEFPDTEDALLTLPGVGPYTAAAIAAIAFGQSATVIDGNVERVIARMFAIETPLPAAKKEIRVRAEALTPDERAGDYAQGLMDLGATVCIPKRPVCGRCPWNDACAARASGLVETLPRRAPKKPKPTRRGVAFWTARPDGAVLLRKRPAQGLLGGMMEVPSSPWTEQILEEEEHLAHAPVKAAWRRRAGLVRHTFTHFHLELVVYEGAGPAAAEADGVWVAPDRLHEHALPTVMKKVAAHALGDDGPLFAAGR